MTSLELAMTRTWAEINLDELIHNAAIIKSCTQSAAKFLGVVKANAYGHGMPAVARKLQEWGADWLAVATVLEGAELRQNGITLPILCLGQTQPELAPLMCQHRITQAVGDLNNARSLSEQAQRLGLTLHVHVKIDSGMSRTGFFWPSDEPAKLAAAREILELSNLPGLNAQGLFTHFAAADDDSEYTQAQLTKFLEARDYLAKSGKTFSLVHASASTGILYRPEARLDMVRAGLILYGYESTDTGNEGSTLDLHPVMTLKSRITAVRSLPAGTTISYGRTYTLKRDSVIAVLPIGYADGLPRTLSNNFSVKIHDTLCPNVGRVCMDMTMIDVTDVPNVKAGEIATVWDGELIPLAAKNAGTIIHEILCMPSQRVPRVYIEDGEMRA